MLKAPQASYSPKVAPVVVDLGSYFKYYLVGCPARKPSLTY